MKSFLYDHGVQEVFPFLKPLTDAHPTIRTRFVERLPGIAVSTDKELTLAHAAPHHQKAIEELGFSSAFQAAQTHGDDLAVIDPASPLHSEKVDGLLTRTPGLLLGIHVADCGALYLVDRKSTALALLHSGKKGTELNILTKAIQQMKTEFHTAPADLIVVLGPCIRPPHYEIDFASTIRNQALEAGVLPTHYHDCGLCTASDLSRFYSYRLEKGLTGRHLALLGHLPS